MQLIHELVCDPSSLAVFEKLFLAVAVSSGFVFMPSQEIVAAKHIPLS